MGKSSDFVELKIPALPEYIAVVRLMISGIASRMGFSYDDIEDIKIAVAEACTNAVSHAYETERGTIIVGCAIDQLKLEITVIDHGKSFDYEKVKGLVGPISPDTAIDQLKEGGLGLFLIQTLMDEVEIFHDTGVIVLMRKYLRRDEVEGDVCSFATSPRR
ncbi:anti-sigma B factor RsbW [Microaerobacter geothermalis]|uniref:anti-sigma B factor RsbW n=1 Tax=Microaerobacter geothermalis TaxID=674972 RepID=UPI001F1A7935|nr:anti-sigma B factor RsbW [Microaerobacter geothermalis]MCF6093752.1 anti-sigma B factor RsbW [Microaerobacter geothermalis]